MELKKNIDLSYCSSQIFLNSPILKMYSRDYRLSTALQPIFSLAHKRAVGFEALLRVKDKENVSISPDKFFNSSVKEEDIIFLDRISRYVHLFNFQKFKDKKNWLFLNVSPQTIVKGKFYGNYFRKLLEQYNFPPHRVVIEIVEHPIENIEKLVKIVDFYKELGCLIAIDDFGAGHSNFDRIWALKPDIVKLDRSLILKASNDKSIRKVILPQIITLLHQSGTLTLIEGIETLDQALIALECNADFVQGFFFGRPFEEFDRDIKFFSDFDGLVEISKEKSFYEEKKINSLLDKFKLFFHEALENLKKGESLCKALEKIVNQELVTRCYLIDSKGIQIGETISSEKNELIKDKRFLPLDDADSADWFRRHYFKNRLLKPLEIQATSPYLSIAGAHMCITLSMMFENMKNEQNILCCDISV